MGFGCCHQEKARAPRVKQILRNDHFRFEKRIYIDLPEEHARWYRKHLKNENFIVLTTRSPGPTCSSWILATPLTCWQRRTSECLVRERTGTGKNKIHKATPSHSCNFGSFSSPLLILEISVVQTSLLWFETRWCSQWERYTINFVLWFFDKWTIYY